ncbi:NAD-dependent epimerase/dehydratase family protein [Jatrophihabitans sp. YIM 134969]
MSRVLVVGATGHVGSWLVPDLVRAGHEVVAFARGTREPYRADDAWSQVERVVVDRDALDADGTFAATVLEYSPDVVVDMVCFTPESATALVEGLAGRVQRLVSCGTVWVHGATVVAPIRESDPRRPYGDYGVQKAAVEQIVLDASDRLPATVLHPGHISGPGWHVVNPVGNLDPTVWRTLAAGEPLAVPLDGVATMVHVHAADVASAFLAAVDAPGAVGRSFHVVAERAASTRGLAEAAAGWFGHEAELRPVTWEQFEATTTPEFAQASREHLQRSHVMSIEAAREHLGWSPRYTSAETLHDAVRWLSEHGELEGVHFA